MPKPIDAMHHFFGKKPGKRCAECPNLVEEYRGDRKVRKCRAYGGYYNSKADWALKYEACGLIEAIALGHMLTNAQKAKFMKEQNRIHEEELPGQIEMGGIDENHDPSCSELAD